MLKAHQYRKLSKKDKGFVRRFLAQVTRFSRAQLTRWMQRWPKTRRERRCVYGNLPLGARSAPPSEVPFSDYVGPQIQKETLCLHLRLSSSRGI